MVNASTSAKVAIIGGGVAGMACALWLKHLGYTPVIIEQHPQLGGQLRDLHRVNRWVLGMPDKTGAELAALYAAHIRQETIDIIYSAQLLALTAAAHGFTATVRQADQPYTLNFCAIVIATGVRTLGLEVFAPLPGFAAAAGLISSFPFDHLLPPDALAGKTVAVIGGGDNAYLTAQDAAQAGAYVQLVVRTVPKARAAVRQAVQKYINLGQIQERTHTQVTAFHSHPNGVTLALSQGGSITVARIFARLGFTANTDSLAGLSALDGLATEHGYIQTDAAQRTNLPWVYAIGDVANARHKSVVNAIAEGAKAAQDLSERGQDHDKQSQ
ncbi:NAD(P)/FAD-dependent oxidoreductase [Methylovulum psychrotolerans]|uniref:FAD/NAD(P)-binding domain-containing protein n=1 Tax=Methylovulum psychrotolerans TaxID=1704499 RepID=A0A1Z4C3M3_9GAMM|nr:NAD(P)/FAD-dependent oxidoreductase [Methylovulum psychrotolerans]ASF48147.1 hypothetical protein CEK71_19925 [Methylovulum psychrotolerans]